MNGGLQIADGGLRGVPVLTGASGVVTRKSEIRNPKSEIV
jgi:hypothetical protein